MKGPRTYLVRCGNQIRFVHVDHLKSARRFQSSSSWEGEGESNYTGNLLSSQAEVRSALLSPSESLVSTTRAGEVPDAGEVTHKPSLGDTAEGTSSSESPSSSHPAQRYPCRERRPPRRLIC